jgi:pimeloyl-ACP methyl ester carboxylesterase
MRALASTILVLTLAAVLILLWPAASMAADPVLSLSQDQWAGAKKELALPTGITLKYVEMGPPEAPAVVLIHGMSHNSRSWSLMAPHLAERYRLIIVDLRGHGDSGKPDIRMYPVSLYAADIAALIDALKLGKVHVVGHSLGSMAAQALAMNFPEKVDKVVLVSSALASFDSLGQGIYAMTVSFGDKAPSDELMEAWYANPNPIDPDFRKRMLAESQSLPPYAWRAIAKGSAASELSHFMTV